MVHVREARTRGPFGNRSLGTRFGFLWFGQAVSQLGDYVAYLTIPVFVASLATSNLDFGIAYALETFPVFLFGLVGGALLDRVRLRPVMIISDFARALAFFALASSAASPDPQLWIVFVVAFIVGSFSTMFNNALYTIIPSLVPEHRLSSANARIAGTQQAMMAAGPLIAGFMAVYAGYSAGFYLNGATFMISALSLVLVGRVRRVAVSERKTYWKETADGFRVVWEIVQLRLTTIAMAVVNFVNGFLEATWVILAYQVLGVTSDSQVGIMFSVMGVGGIIGAILAPTIVRRLGLGRPLVAGMLVFGLGVLIVTNGTFGVATLLVFLVAMIGFSVFNVPIFTIRQVYSPPEMLGRVTTASRALGWATLPIGALVGTWLADQRGYEVMVRVAPLMIVATAVFLAFTPVRNAKQPSPN